VWKGNRRQYSERTRTFDMMHKYGHDYFPLEKVTVKFITIKSARGHSYRACELALQQLASKRFPLEKVTTHTFGLKDVDLAIRSVGGQGVPDVIHASLMPWK